MNEYTFSKRYNPAYDFFLIRYFNRGGIEFDDTTSFRESQARAWIGEGLPKPSSQEKLFLDYVSVWRAHPEARPAFEGFFERTVDGKLSVEVLSTLEKEVPHGQGKLLFAASEVAKCFADFYRKIMKDPLRQSMEEGMDGGQLMRIFFSTPDIRKVPAARFLGDEMMEAGANRVAGELLSWLDAIRPENIEADIHHVFDEHRQIPDHMTRFQNMDEKGWHWSCIHTSEYVELNCYRDEREIEETITIQPSRGFRVSDYVIALGWEYVIFPQFHLMPEDQGKKVETSQIRKIGNQGLE
jgi:hypothetical protein